ncbi:hypothetical protein BDFG_04865 [Blastomyces dermatitidis ATCC 26199]|nr:hypothetical protein BDFG_04865 [Blastomyces dermatitidis ATCC 26199]
MNFWDLLEVLPTLSADGIREFWHPAMVQQAERIDRRKLNSSDEARVPSYQSLQPSFQELYTLADLETVKQHCEERLNAKETEITELRQLHECRLNMLWYKDHSKHTLAQSRFRSGSYPSRTPNLTSPARLKRNTATKLSPRPPSLTTPNPTQTPASNNQISYSP